MAEKIIETLRDFPSVEELLQHEALAADMALLPRPVAAQIVKDTIKAAKVAFGKAKKKVTLDVLLRGISRDCVKARRREICRVINAAGIVVHTNLGRAPLSETLFDEVKKTVTGYGNIEFDLATGKRGSRGTACERYLAMLSEAESATVVNNGAAALFLILNTLANRKPVVISRGELVQIGGGFRIPDILKRSGARLEEIGSTNITEVKDYEDSLTEKTGLILKVHKSNFIQAGFSEEVDLKPLVKLGRQRGVPVVNDLGSGVFVPTQPILGHMEPTVQQSVRAGADLTCFSGDKMLGGVQAGMIVGRADLIKKIKRNPLFRTMRVDKIVFSMLEKLFTIYLNGDHTEKIKLWAMLSVGEADLYRRAKGLVARLGNPAGVSVEATKAYVGGGSLPEAHLPSVGIVFSPDYRPTDLIRRFRELPLPVIGRVEADRFILDLKAVAEEDLETLENSIREILAT